jgi:hypothetical protein
VDLVKKGFDFSGKTYVLLELSLISFRSLNAVVGFFEAEQGLNRASRADAAFLIEHAVSGFPGHAEEELASRPQAFGITGTWIADTEFFHLIRCFTASRCISHFYLRNGEVAADG